MTRYTNILHVGDQHLDDKPENAYRWKLFPTIKKMINPYKIGAVIFYGDLTEYKDRHTGIFINQVQSSIETYLKDVEVFIMKGNHDYKDPCNPTFKFLDMIPNVTYITEPSLQTVSTKEVLFLPHCDDPATDSEWEEALNNSDIADFICTHITVDKAEAENGQSLSGVSTEFFRGKKVYSGDVHVPQVIKNVTYIGMPYRKNFGDSYNARLLLTTEEGDRSLLTSSLFVERHLVKISSVEELDSFEFKENDQLKIRYFISNSDLLEWDSIYASLRACCKEHKWDLQQVEAVLKQTGLSESSSSIQEISYDPAEILKQFMEEKYPDINNFYSKSGIEIIEQVEIV